jgi:hypothetical protein
MYKNQEDVKNQLNSSRIFSFEGDKIKRAITTEAERLLLIRREWQYLICANKVCELDRVNIDGPPTETKKPPDWVAFLLVEQAFRKSNR